MSREPSAAEQAREMPALPSKTPVLESILNDVSGDLSRLAHEPGPHQPLPSVRFRRDLRGRADELHEFVTAASR